MVKLMFQTEEYPQEIAECVWQWRKQYGTPHSDCSLAKARKRAGIPHCRFFNSWEEKLRFFLALRHPRTGPKGLQQMFDEEVEKISGNKPVEDWCFAVNLPDYLRSIGISQVSKGTIKRYADTAGIDLRGRKVLTKSVLEQLVEGAREYQSKRYTPREKPRYESEYSPKGYVEGLVSWAKVWERLSTNFPQVFHESEQVRSAYRKRLDLQGKRMLTLDEALLLTGAILLGIKTEARMSFYVGNDGFKKQVWDLCAYLMWEENPQPGIIPSRLLPKPSMMSLPLHVLERTGEKVTAGWCEWQLRRRHKLKPPANLLQEIPVEWVYHLVRDVKEAKLKGHSTSERFNPTS